MNKLKLISSVAIILFAGSANASKADFVDHEVYTTDTKSKLDWLDVTETMNKSFNQITSQLGMGGELEGWRYATGKEFNQMLMNYTDQVFSVAEHKTVKYAEGLMDGLVDLIGRTSDYDTGSRTGDPIEGMVYTYGLVSDYAFSPASELVYLALIMDLEEGDRFSDRSNPHNAPLRKTSFKANTGQHIGSYLVRNTEVTVVPLPATAWFMGSGLLGLMGVAQNRKNKHS